MVSTRTRRLNIALVISVLLLLTISTIIYLTGQTVGHPLLQIDTCGSRFGTLRSEVRL